MEGLLSGGQAFESDVLIAPDIVVYEVANALFVQHRVLHRIEDGLPYVDRMYKAVQTKSLVLVPGSRDLALEAYEIASQYGQVVYDCMYVALALRSDLELGTRDRRQARTFEAERRKRRQKSLGGDATEMAP